jgi:GT2 family glycosyltransferase
MSETAPPLRPARSDRPLVSVIIPTHNRASLLARAVASVNAQERIGELFDVEIIVVDDHSTDDTAEVAPRLPRVRYLRTPINRGVCAARNIGISAASGEFLSLLDDDDEWLPGKLALQVPLLRAHPEIGLVYGQNRVIRGNEVSLWPSADAPSGQVFRQLLLSDFIPARTLLIRSEALREVGGFDETLGHYELNDLCLRLTHRFPVIFQPGAVAIYNRTNEGSFARGLKDGSSARNADIVYEKALALLPDTPEDNALRRSARAQLKMRQLLGLEWLGEQEWVLRTLESELRDPSLVGEPAVRAGLASVISRAALATSAPERTVQHLRAIADRAAGASVRTIRDRISSRRLWAEVWLAVAAGLGERGRARRAVAQAAMGDPTLLRSRDTIQIALGRGNRRAEDQPAAP